MISRAEICPARTWLLSRSTTPAEKPTSLSCPPSGFAYPADDAGTFEYVCAVEVDAVGPIPTGLIAIDLPPQRYAVFEHRGRVDASESLNLG